MKDKEPQLILGKVLKQKNISKYEFAKLLKKPTSNVAVYFQKNYSPTFKTLKKWAKVLNCKISDLIEE